MCGIPKDTITQWASDAKITTDVITSTREATLTIAAKRQLKREQLIDEWFDFGLDALRRRDKEHIDYKGSGAEKVTYPEAPAGAMAQYAQAASEAVKNINLLTGFATARTESTTRVMDVVTGDHEREALTRAITLGLELAQMEQHSSDEK